MSQDDEKLSCAITEKEDEGLWVVEPGFVYGLGREDKTTLYNDIIRKATVDGAYVCPQTWPTVSREESRSIQQREVILIAAGIPVDVHYHVHQGVHMLSHYIIQKLFEISGFALTEKRQYLNLIPGNDKVYFELGYDFTKLQSLDAEHTQELPIFYHSRGYICSDKVYLEYITTSSETLSTAIAELVSKYNQHKANPTSEHKESVGENGVSHDHPLSFIESYGANLEQNKPLSFIEAVAAEHKENAPRITEHQRRLLLETQATAETKAESGYAIDYPGIAKQLLELGNEIYAEHLIQKRNLGENEAYSYGMRVRDQAQYRYFLLLKQLLLQPIIEKLLQQPATQEEKEQKGLAERYIKQQEALLEKLSSDPSFLVFLEKHMRGSAQFIMNCVRTWLKTDEVDYQLGASEAAVRSQIIGACEQVAQRVTDLLKEFNVAYQKMFGANTEKEKETKSPQELIKVNQRKLQEYSSALTQQVPFSLRFARYHLAQPVTSFHPRDVGGITDCLSILCKGDQPDFARYFKASQLAAGSAGNAVKTTDKVGNAYYVHLWDNASLESKNNVEKQHAEQKLDLSHRDQDLALADAAIFSLLMMAFPGRATQYRKMQVGEGLPSVITSVAVDNNGKFAELFGDDNSPQYMFTEFGAILPAMLFLRNADLGASNILHSQEGKRVTAIDFNKTRIAHRRTLLPKLCGAESETEGNAPSANDFLHPELMEAKSASFTPTQWPTRAIVSDSSEEKYWQRLIEAKEYQRNKHVMLLYMLLAKPIIDIIQNLYIANADDLQRVKGDDSATYANLERVLDDAEFQTYLQQYGEEDFKKILDYVAKFLATPAFRPITLFIEKPFEMICQRAEAVIKVSAVEAKTESKSAVSIDPQQWIASSQEKCKELQEKYEETRFANLLNDFEMLSKYLAKQLKRIENQIYTIYVREKSDRLFILLKDCLQYKKCLEKSKDNSVKLKEYLIEAPKYFENLLKATAVVVHHRTACLLTWLMQAMIGMLPKSWHQLDTVTFSDEANQEQLSGIKWFPKDKEKRQTTLTHRGKKYSFKDYHSADAFFNCRGAGAGRQDLSKLQEQKQSIIQQVLAN